MHAVSIMMESIVFYADSGSVDDNGILISIEGIVSDDMMARKGERVYIVDKVVISHLDPLA